jgi:hypothetical protein
MTKNLNLKKIYILSGATTLILGILCIVSAISFIIPTKLAGTNSGWFTALQNNWLIIIFKLHAGLINIQDNPLHGLNFLDIIILVLFSIACSGLYFNLRKFSKIWSLISLTLSLITIILFLITQIVGRSTVMFSVLIFSIVMIRYKFYSKVNIYSGILASIFLFAGDLTVGIQSNFITILFSIGYIFLTLWLFLISRKLLLLGKYEKELGMI